MSKSKSSEVRNAAEVVPKKRPKSPIDQLRERQVIYAKSRGQGAAGALSFKAIACVIVGQAIYGGLKGEAEPAAGGMAGAAVFWAIGESFARESQYAGVRAATLEGVIAQHELNSPTAEPVQPQSPES